MTFSHENQLHSMRKLVSHVFQKSKFYSALYQKHGIREHNISSLNFEDLPIIKKNDLIDNIQDIWTDPTLNLQEVTDFIFQQDRTQILFKNKYVCFTTSGSLGTKLPIIHADTEWNQITSAILQGDSLSSASSQCRTKVAGIFRTSGTSVAVTLLRAAPKELYDVREISILSSLSEIVVELNEFQPDHVAAYPGIFLSLLPYQRNGVLKIFPKFVSLGGEILTHEQQKEITELFRTTVVNNYGASECLILGSKYLGDSHFRMLPQFAKIEILNDKNEHVKEGETGRVILTNLFNYTQPFLRYEIGDIALCGVDEQGSFCINNIVSRNYRPVYFENNQGEQSYFHPFILPENFMYVKGVHKSQIVLDKNAVQLRVVASDEGFSLVVENFRKFLIDQNLDQKVLFKVDRVEEIHPEQNGKIPFIKYASVVLAS